MTLLGGEFSIKYNDTLCEDRAVDLKSQLLDNGNDFDSTIYGNNGDCL